MSDKLKTGMKIVGGVVAVIVLFYGYVLITAWF